MSANHPYVRYVIAIALTASALVAAQLLKPIFDPSYFLPFLAAVLVSSWVGGLRAGFLAAALTVGAACSVDPPDNGMSIARVSTFVVSATIVTYLAGTVRNINVRWKQTLNSIGDGVVLIDRKGCVQFLNAAAEAMTGWATAEVKRKPLEAFLKIVDEKDGQPQELPAKALLEEGKVFRASRQRILVARDGHRVWVEESSGPIRNDKGKVNGAILVFRDVTARREAQNQMSQSQKMEAVGRLASGAAGDFNNLLTVITGYSEMLRAELEEGDPLRQFSDEIFRAADRASGLTRQLVALGRRQAGVLKVQDLSALICSMETMLRRLLGENIELVILPGTGRVKADAAQMEQLIVNLALNSRDAMPQGGKFVIEIANMEIEEGQQDQWPGVPPGSYVTMAVSDTGTGMDAETRAHLFEPFFTTKTRGTGTGLGLSIVYGIVQQCEGSINVYSQLGAGTIFEIFLPRAKGAVETFLPAVRRTAKKGSETILIADDEDGVRRLVHAILATNGYNVLEARDGVEALTLYEGNRSQVDMVVTDMVMPNMGGRELGERLYRLHPALRVLYISGYREGPIGETAYERELVFLQKPFTPAELLAKVRDLLDRQTPEARNVEA